MAFDGQYIKLGVSKNLKRMLMLEEETVIPLSLDPMQKVKLSQNDIISNFVTCTLKIINKSMKILKFGKILERLISCADKILVLK